MSSDSIFIISGEEVAPAGGRHLGARGDRSVSTHINEQSVSTVKENMNGFLKNLGQILSLEEDVKGDYVIDKVEVNAQITGEGKIGLLGTGVNVGASTGLKIVLQRKGR